MRPVHEGATPPRMGRMPWSAVHHRPNGKFRSNNSGPLGTTVIACATALKQHDHSETLGNPTASRAAAHRARKKYKAPSCDGGAYIAVGSLSGRKNPRKRHAPAPPQ